MGEDVPTTAVGKPKVRKRPGPKGKAPDEGARISHSIRLKPSIAAKLRVAAEVNHRSLGEEMEFRINQSFEGLATALDRDLASSLRFAANIASISFEDEVRRRLSLELTSKEITGIAKIHSDFGNIVWELNDHSKVIEFERSEKAAQELLSRYDDLGEAILKLEAALQSVDNDRQHALWDVIALKREEMLKLLRSMEPTASYFAFVLKRTKDLENDMLGPPQIDGTAIERLCTINIKGERELLVRLIRNARGEGGDDEITAADFK